MIYRRYIDLWEALGELRLHASAESVMAACLARAPAVHPAHADPFHRFASYPSRAIGADTIVQAAPAASRAAYEALIARPMFSFWQMRPEVAESVIAAAASPISVAALAARVGRQVGPTTELIARLAKMNLIILHR